MKPKVVIVFIILQIFPLTAKAVVYILQIFPLTAKAVVCILQIFPLTAKAVACNILTRWTYHQTFTAKHVDFWVLPGTVFSTSAFSSSVISKFVRQTGSLAVSGRFRFTSTHERTLLGHVSRFHQSRARGNMMGHNNCCAFAPQTFCKLPENTYKRLSWAKELVQNVSRVEFSVAKR